MLRTLENCAAFASQLDHAKTVFEIGPKDARLMRRMRCGNEQNLLQMENFSGFARHFQVSCMYRVEGTAKDRDFQFNYGNRLWERRKTYVLEGEILCHLLSLQPRPQIRNHIRQTLFA